MAHALATASHETHLSRLFFTPDRVYKQLKPVELPFVDFSDTSVRCEAATHEFERNRQISPDVYLGLADVFEGDVLVDRMIVMRRLRDKDALPRLLNKGNNKALIQSAARCVARMHASLVPLRGDDAQPGSRSAIEQNFADNFAAIQPHVGRCIDSDDFAESQFLVESYLAGRDELFASRIEDGWVRDGHGDLRAEHIYCTEDGPRMIDCVAFDDRLRVSDALCDVAFLAMDLDRLVGPDAAVQLMRAWNEYTNESHPSSLAHFYVAYRAHVRCKIACLRHEQRMPGADQTARRYHDQALRHLRLARMRLIVVGGGAGTGKSTIAEAVAASTGAVWLRSDEIRKDLAGMGHGQHAFDEPGAGMYSEDMNAQVCAEVFRQARSLLQSGMSVVLDATWREAHARQDLRRLAEETSAAVSELCCVLATEVAKERITLRLASDDGPSDATPDVVDYISEHFDDWPEATEIDTSGTIASSVETALSVLYPSMKAPTGHDPNSGEEDLVADLKLRRDFILLTGGLDGPE